MKKIFVLLLGLGAAFPAFADNDLLDGAAVFSIHLLLLLILLAILPLVLPKWKKLFDKNTAGKKGCDAQATNSKEKELEDIKKKKKELEEELKTIKIANEGLRQQIAQLRNNSQNKKGKNKNRNGQAEDKQQDIIETLRSENQELQQQSAPIAESSLAPVTDNVQQSAPIAESNPTAPKESVAQTIKLSTPKLDPKTGDYYFGGEAQENIRFEATSTDGRNSWSFKPTCEADSLNNDSLRKVLEIEGNPGSFTAYEVLKEGVLEKNSYGEYIVKEKVKIKGL